MQKITNRKNEYTIYKLIAPPRGNIASKQMSNEMIEKTKVECKRILHKYK